MRKVDLCWFGLGSVRLLYEVLKSDEHFRNLAFPELNNFGFYMYLNRDNGRSRYIGQAFKNSPMALRSRIRWEIVKDGNGCAESAFCRKCQEYKVDRFELMIKVAHLKNPLKDGTATEVDTQFMNAIERALIFERAKVKDPLMNETGKDSYRLEPVEIVNYGDFKPLPNRIFL